VRARAGGTIAGDVALARLFLAAAAGAVLAYAAAVVLLARRPVAVAAIVAVGSAIQLAPLAAPLLLSTDAWTYWDYGRIGSVHAGNPYADVPADFPDDPAFRYVGRDWRDSSSVYGPAFTLASEPLALAAGQSEDAAAWIFKVLAAAAMLAAAALAAVIARRPAYAFALVSWNPVLALHFAGGGHNDAWMAALVVAALALAASGRQQLAGGAWAAALLVKWVPVVLLPLAALAARARAQPFPYVGLVVAAAVLALLAAWRYGFAWLEAAAPIVRNARTETEYALPHRLTQLGSPRWLALTAAAVAFTVVYAWLLREAWRGRARLGVGVAALLVATPYLAPWYLAWLVPLAAAEDDDRVATALAVALTAYLLPQTIPA